ncbi:recombinase family protein [Lysinibacillus sp. 54212]|uniref:recombinase family protein n=1 Tax=Lysinibacillus sp. 54212 TaxID=3119829 RepID=UPI002FC6D3FA
MKAVLYYRVSTKLQEDKYSLKAQKEELTKYADSQGWEILSEFKDVDSGGKLDKEGLNALMDYVEDHSVDVVLCIDQDRLSRLDTVNWEFLKDVLRENGVKIAEPGSIVDLTNEDDEFISDIKNLIAKREKRAIVRRMMRGKRQRTREGKGWGAPPIEYNYDKNTSTYSVNDTWSWIIPFIDELYLEKGYSDTQIAKELNAITKTPRGKRWSEASVRQKLTNEAYCGRMIKTFSNGETIVVEDVYPRLRTDEQQQKILEKRKSKFRRKPESTPQLLRRVNMTCAYCGRKLSIHMSGIKQYGVHFYIIHNKQERLTDGSKCTFNINTIRVEQNIIRAVKDIIKGEDFAKAYIQLDHSPEDLQLLESGIKTLTKAKTDTHAKIDRLLPLYLDGSWSKEQLDQQKILLENELKTHDQRLKQLTNKRDLIKANLFNYEAVVDYLGVAARFDTLLDKEDQMHLIGRLFPQAVVYEDHIIMQGLLTNNVPLEIRVPIDPNPYDRKQHSRTDRDPKGKYERVQLYLKDNPDASLRVAAKELGIAESTIYRLEKKFGPLEHGVILEQDAAKKIEIIKAYLKENPGAINNQISRDTGLAKTTVNRLVKRYNLKK